MKKWLPIFLVFPVLLSYQNCSKKSFDALREQEKVQTLEENPIFPTQIDQPSETPPGDLTTTTTVTTSSTVTTTTIGSVTTIQPVITTTLPPTTTLKSTTTTVSINLKPIGTSVKTLCSDDRTTINDGVNATTATDLRLKLFKATSSTVVCEENDTAYILAGFKNKKVQFSNCKPSDGDYRLSVEAKIGSGSWHTILMDGDLSKITTSSFDTYASMFVFMGNLGFKNSQHILMDHYNLNFARNSNPANPLYKGSDCSENASPLYVDFRRDASDMDILSSPQSGVWFDIMGKNAQPKAYEKIKISWFERGRFALLALPITLANGRQEIKGIDQLFGDNTQGPDGKFAANGFLALSKYDVNQDGMIDSKDPIFQKLRLWFDTNRNGIAEHDERDERSNELLPLSQKQILAIDLRYDPHFSERDQYGNEIKFKSVVYRLNAKPKPIFDVWFKVQP